MEPLRSQDVLHPNDHFTQKSKYPFRWKKLPELALGCAKGIEITSEGPNPKTIKQAVHQLSYAMAKRITDGMRSQVDPDSTFSETIFYHIPIVVTTAKLFVADEKMTTRIVKSAEEIDDIATEVDGVVLRVNARKDLEKPNNRIFKKFINKYGIRYLNANLVSYNKDIRFICSVMSRHHSPEAVLVIHHSDKGQAFDSLFQLIDQVASSTPEPYWRKNAPGNSELESSDINIIQK